MSAGSGVVRAALLLGAALLAACATPAQRYDATARELGLTRRRLEVEGGDLVVYARPADRPGHRLHVYLEGDGHPRRAARYVPPDPTPVEPQMIRLMALDPAPAILLGRPCHHGVYPRDPRRERW